jgi:hypothetical protein
VCHVSAVSRGRSPVNCFSQLGPQLFVITGEAVTSHSRSSPILMGWWSAQRNDYRSPLVELANTTSSVKGITKRRIIEQPRGFSEYFGGFRPLPERRCALRIKASAMAMLSLLHQGEDAPTRHTIPEEAARRDRAKVPLLCLGGPTEKYGIIIHRTKSARPRNARKSCRKYSRVPATSSSTLP